MKLRDSIALFLSIVAISLLFYMGGVLWVTSMSQNVVELSNDSSKDKTSNSETNRHSNHNINGHLNPRIGKTTKGWKPGSGHLMLNVEEKHLKRDDTTLPKTQVTHTVLYYTPRTMTEGVDDNMLVKRDCLYSNCKFTNDQSTIEKSTAVIFQASSETDTKPPARPRDQVWILSDTENELPVHGFNGSNWKNAINWTISYRLDADIFWTPGTLRTDYARSAHTADIATSVETRTKSVMTFVTNCTSFENSGLKNYALELQKYVDLHIFGQCPGTKPLDRRELKVTAASYSLFLVLEDFRCSEYVSKDIYEYFDLDTVLVVRGSNYEQLFPQYLFFNAAEYDGVASLGKGLNAFMSDSLKYTKYLRNKYVYSVGPGLHWQCDLCEKLNNLDQNKQVYESVVHMLNRTKCLTNENTRRRPVMQIVIVAGIGVFFLTQFWKYCCRFYCRNEDGKCRISYFDGMDWSQVPLIGTPENSASVTSEDDTVTLPNRT